ncbi:twin-arginine translocase TatA/TatE family subunit [Pedobacter sp. SYP-B3415]|uniref:Sec-independent protein translocase subunit TatA/TatB n=1 Tax=Pedobacter sp. SYP-B3415 TaxID=2496641 RepID=UPI00101B690A|nr:twin-arginine translocase TatA/TatE family subunit [Pedobacter sp. SYP-B3415]
MLHSTLAAGVFGMGGGELIVIALVLLLLFGGKKIPELMKGLGKGVKEFKDGKDGLEKEPAEQGKESKTTV